MKSKRYIFTLYLLIFYCTHCFSETLTRESVLNMGRTFHYALEAHDLDSLLFFKPSNSEINCIQYVEVLDSEYYFYRLFIGDYVGKNYGILQDINDDSIVVKEVYEIDGEWVVFYKVIELKN